MCGVEAESKCPSVSTLRLVIVREDVFQGVLKISGGLEVRSSRSPYDGGGGEGGGLTRQM